MTTSDTRWSCSAQLDLLGFSNQLVVANWDTRTPSGAVALGRLDPLEDALRLLEKEKTDYPHLYPRGLQYRRFNDCLFLGIDAEHLAPPQGQTTLTGGYSISELRRLHPDPGVTTSQGTTAESGSDVAKLLGLVARMHKYVNSRERQASFPGCRTVVASGLREGFRDRVGTDDFFSLNLSLAMAFEAQQIGSSAGLGGSHLFVENDVAVAISYCETCAAILGFSKFLRGDSSPRDPYVFHPDGPGSVGIPRAHWTIPEPINVDILRKHLRFRRLNPTVLTNLQLFKDYQELAAQGDDTGVNKAIADSLSASTPSLERINDATSLFASDGKEYPFLSLEFGLEADYCDFFGRE